MAVVAASDKEKTEKSLAKLSDILAVPNLIQGQLDSFRWFQEEGLKELLEEISPIKDSTGTKLEQAENSRHHFVAGHRFSQR